MQVKYLLLYCLVFLYQFIQVLLFGYLYPILYWSPFKCRKKSTDSISLDIESIPLDEICETSSNTQRPTSIEKRDSNEEISGSAKNIDGQTDADAERKNTNIFHGKGKSPRGTPPKAHKSGNVFFIKSKEEMVEEIADENNRIQAKVEDCKEKTTRSKCKFYCMK